MVKKISTFKNVLLSLFVGFFGLYETINCFSSNLVKLDFNEFLDSFKQITLNADDYQPLNNQYYSSKFESIETINDYPWITNEIDNVVLQSGNSKVNNSLSVLKINVKGSGAFVFDYKVFAPTLEQEAVPDSFYVSIGSEITSELIGTYLNDTSNFKRVFGNTEWENMIFSINATEDYVTTIYLAYSKNGKYSDPIDCVYVKNMVFNNQEVTITALSSNSEYGSVSGGGSFFAGTEISLKADVLNNGKFYGWKVDGKRLEEESPNLNITVGIDKTIEAIFGNEEETLVRNITSGDVYTSLKDSFDDSSSNDVIELLKDYTLDSNLTIPSGRTLYIPYQEQIDLDGNKDGTTNESLCMADSSKTYRKLTIDNDATLNLNGKLLIGGVIGYPSQYYQGHTSGAHGKIINKGNITVNGGEISCFGYIEGQGIIDVINNGNVYEPFVVFDFAGGSNCAQLYFINQSSFTQYTMQNISCELNINYGSHLYAYCNLYASGEFNKTIANIVGTEDELSSTLFGLKEGAKFTRTVDKTMSIKNATSIGGDYGSDIYRVSQTIDGGASLNNLEMEVYGINISVANFTIPYCSEIILENGNYNIDKGWILYPGATLKVDSDAKLDVNGRLYALEGLFSTGMSGKYYPNAIQLQEEGFSASSNLIINGQLDINKNATFGGIIQSTSTNASIKVNRNAIVINNQVQIGGTACYDDNTNVMKLDGRLYIDDKLVTLTPGRTYTCNGVSSWVKENYTISKYVVRKSDTIPENEEYATIPSGGSTPYAVYGGPKVVIINEQMYGSFSMVAELISKVTIIKRSFYSEGDDGKSLVDNIETSKDSLSFTLNSTIGNEIYKHMVEYKVDDGEYINISNVIGLYHLDGLEGEVTIRITSGIKGDVDLDGDLTSSDVTLICRYFAGYSGLTNLKCIFLADLDDDGLITTDELTKIRRYFAGYINMI